MVGIGWPLQNIIEIYQQIHVGIAVSTWGERRSMDFKAYYNSTHSWGGGFVYFK